MRYQEFNLTEDELFELSMSPSNLQRMAANINALAGMEFEMIVPGVESDQDEYESEPDYEADEGFPTGRGWTREVIQFFRGGDMGNSTSTIQRAIDSLNEDFYAWIEEDQEEFINSIEGRDRAVELAADSVDRADYESDDEYRNAVLQYADENEDDIRDQLTDEYNEDLDSKFEEWLAEQDIGTMSDFANEYNLDWPYWTEPYSDGGGSGISIDTVADEFSDAIGRPVNASSRYHGGTREAGKYVVEPDSSLEGDNPGDSGLEFVSPPLPLNEMLSDLDKVAKWAKAAGAYTNDSTGLHMNVSVPDFSNQNLDYVKLAIFLGDEYVLKQFGRVGNTYCKSAMAEITRTARMDPDKVKTMLQQMQGNLSAMASKIVHTGTTSKYTSINTQDGYIEFRSPGGDWLSEYAADPGKLKNTLLRFVVALDVAMKPEAFRQEYMKKLYKTLSPDGSDDTIQFFARYAAGELPTTALKAFVKNAQEKRQRGKQEKDQIDSTYKELSGVSREQLPPVDFNGNYEVYAVGSGNVIYRFRVNNTQEAYDMLQRWRQTMMQPGLDPREYNVRAVAAQQPAPGTGSLPPGNVRWRVLDQNDQEVYSFINTTSQSDANQYARNWMINTAPREVRERGPFTIVPAQ